MSVLIEVGTSASGSAGVSDLVLRDAVSGLAGLPANLVLTGKRP